MELISPIKIERNCEIERAEYGNMNTLKQKKNGMKLDLEKILKNSVEHQPYENEKNMCNRIDIKTENQELEKLFFIESQGTHGNLTGIVKNENEDLWVYAASEKYCQQEFNPLNLEKDGSKVLPIFKCDYCDYTAKKKHYLKCHIDKVHLNAKAHKCHLCDYATHNKYLLQSHLTVVHIKLKDFKFHYCDYATNRKHRLESHIKGEHMNLKEHCFICEFSTTNKSNLKIHIDSVHMKLKNYRCHLCDYAANQNCIVKSHIEVVHLKLKNFQCGLCDYATNRMYVLRNHVNDVHGESRKHKCRRCDYVTLSKYDFKTHTKVAHLNLKEHKCECCEYATSIKSNLTRHIKTKHSTIGSVLNCDVKPKETKDNKEDIVMMMNSRENIKKR
ncbi:zinc finger protein 711-like [Coccinella septempunctata]|uniref:zinc finger protein 711-like n=1 Tax=Coccinella septempunctata TaxID=41139 RepID=UPI001D0978A4|nr:zinc finger protein 711-like [Coccinella septempunctata]